MFIQISTTSAGYPRGTFFTAPHSAARDSSISFAARGLLMYVLSRGDGWRLTAWEMKAQGMGRTAFDSAVRELEQAGYLAREQQRDPRTGQWMPATWQLTMRENAATVAQNPHTENPNAVNPNADEPHSVNVQESVNLESANHPTENQVTENQSSALAHAPTDDDDSIFPLPADFGKLTQEQRTELQAEVTRLGAERVREVVERVRGKAGVKRLAAYLLTALKNESESAGTSTPPSSACPPLLSGKYADFVERGWNMPTPSPDVCELASESGDAVDNEPPQYSQREADMFRVAIDQLKHQLDRGTFEAYVMGLTLIRSENGGKRLVLQSKSPNALEMLRGRLFRNVHAVIHDFVNLSCPRSEFEIVFESAPVEMPGWSWLAGVGA